MITRSFLMHALSPLHAGTGQSVDVIDLPIARMRATRIPFVPGSSIKGVLRWTRRQQLGVDDHSFLSTFGPETEVAHEHAGALMVGDARLLLLPVRSFKGTFAYVTSPLLLSLAARDLRESGIKPPALPPPGDGPQALTTKTSLNLHVGSVYLEDLNMPGKDHPAVDAWAELLAPWIAPTEAPELFKRRLIVVDDQSMSFLWETATQVDARIRLDPNTRTVVDGALWHEESLPPETVLIGLLMATQGMRAKGGVPQMKADQVLELALPDAQVLQFGGKATVGRGRARLCPVSGTSTKG